MRIYSHLGGSLPYGTVADFGNLVTSTKIPGYQGRALPKSDNVDCRLMPCMSNRRSTSVASDYSNRIEFGAPARNSLDTFDVVTRKIAHIICQIHNADPLWDNCGWLKLNYALAGAAHCAGTGIPDEGPCSREPGRAASGFAR